MTFFTIISSVIAVSGATYAAMAAMSHRWEKSVDSKAEKLEEIHEIVKDDLEQGDCIFDEISSCVKKFNKSKKQWNRLHLIPIAGFIIFSFFVSTHVIIVWNEKYQISNFMEIVYRFGLLSLLTVYAYCMVRSVISYLQIRSLSNSAKSFFAIHNENKNKKNQLINEESQKTVSSIKVKDY